MKKIITGLLILSLILTASFGFSLSKSSNIDYGVFLGAKRSKLLKLKGYNTLVLDAETLSKDDMNKIKSQNKEIYSYLNVGSIEDFRNYYDEMKDLTLGDYENWPEEKWVDVSKIKWQDFVVEKLAFNLAKKGIDGFFIDNLDVYYKYESEETYEGIINILKRLFEKYKLKILINGGDTFIYEAIKNKDLKKLGITGVNQETVFSKIDFKNNKFLPRTKKDRKYYKDYIKTVKKNNLEVFILEYVKNDKSLVKKIYKFANKNGYRVYISKTLELT